MRQSSKSQAVAILMILLDQAHSFIHDTQDAPAQIEAPVTAHPTGSPGVIAERIACTSCQNMCHAQGQAVNQQSRLTPAFLAACQVIRMYHYTTQNDKEPAFSKGQIITILNKEDPNWWKEEVNRQVELFPSNYLKLTTGMDTSQQ